MSSEDSEDDGSFAVCALPWRSEKATSFLLSLDRKLDKRRSRKSKVMTFERKMGLPSDRPKPVAGSTPGWVIRP